MKYILYTDGAARGNPGPAAIGVVLTDTHGRVVQALGLTIGQATNNEAEYQAILKGLELAAAQGADSVEIRTDSELLAQQLNGRYRVRAQNLKPLHERVLQALKRLAHVSIHHIPRELNRRADSLANQALDRSSPKAFRRDTTG